MGTITAKHKSGRGDTYVCEECSRLGREFEFITDHQPSVYQHKQWHKRCAVGKTIELLENEQRCPTCKWPCHKKGITNHINKGCNGYPHNAAVNDCLRRHELKFNKELKLVHATSGNLYKRTAKDLNGAKTEPASPPTASAAPSPSQPSNGSNGNGASVKAAPLSEIHLSVEAEAEIQAEARVLVSHYAGAALQPAEFVGALRVVREFDAWLHQKKAENR